MWTEFAKKVSRHQNPSYPYHYSLQECYLKLSQEGNKSIEATTNGRGGADILVTDSFGQKLFGVFKSSDRCQGIPAAFDLAQSWGKIE